MRSTVACLLIFAAVPSLSVRADSPGPQPAPLPPPIPAPLDRPYPGTITLAVDATDTARNIIRVHEVVPVTGSELILLYPEWIPGHHAPTGRTLIDRVAGLTISAGRTHLSWLRDPVNVEAFHVAVPAGISGLNVDFQYLSPPAAGYGSQTWTTELLTLDWNTVLLYPAGYFARQIPVQVQITLPPDWTAATALPRAADGGTTNFAPVPLDTLVDSPLYAGRNAAVLDLAPGARVPVRLNLFADRPEQVAVNAAQLTALRSLVQQAVRLFGSQHYDHYDFLVSLSDTLRVQGVEHHRSSFDGLHADNFVKWEDSLLERDLLSHEYVHSWNGKFRRPADLWTPNYNVPMRNSLLWVYEGMTQYWGAVLAARSGLWSRDEALDALALIASRFQAEPGRDWRSLEDTTNQPIVNAGVSQSWRSWQRTVDYYDVGLLIWLDADTLIREKSRGRRSLDDFARRFFGVQDGSWGEVTYTFDDVVAALNAVLPYDWATFLRSRLDAVGGEAPLDGIRRGGYRLVFTDAPSAMWRSADSEAKATSFSDSIGLSVDNEGKLKSVLWNSPAWQAGLAVGTQLVAVDAMAFDVDRLKAALDVGMRSKGPLELLVREGDRFRTVRIDYHGGLRYPHLIRESAAPATIDQILAPRR